MNPGLGDSKSLCFLCNRLLSCIRARLGPSPDFPTTGAVVSQDGLPDPGFDPASAVLHGECSLPWLMLVRGSAAGQEVAGRAIW